MKRFGLMAGLVAAAILILAREPTAQWLFGSSANTSLTPSRAVSFRSPSHEPTCVGFVATVISPAPVNHASTCSRSQKRPIASTLRDAAIASSIASASPKRRAISGTAVHHAFTKPPLRPDGPPPQMSCSTITTSIAGSRSFRW